MKYIITESQYHSLEVRRRIDEIKGLIKNLYAYIYPCDFDNFDSFLFSIIYGIKHELSLDWIEKEHFELVEKVITDFLSKELYEYYTSKCLSAE